MEALAVNASRAADIKTIVGIGSGRLSAIADSLSGHPISVAPSELLNVFSEQADRDSSQILLRHLASLMLLMDDKNASSAEVLDALRAGLERHGLNDAELNEFDSIKASLQSLLNSETLYVSVKATSILSSDSLHLHKYKIYSDARPVFDRGRSSIKGILIYSTLHIVASDARENEKSWAICLGYEELHELRDECGRAIAKIDEFEESLKKGAVGEIVRYGG